MVMSIVMTLSVAQASIALAIALSRVLGWRV